MVPTQSEYVVLEVIGLREKDFSPAYGNAAEMDKATAAKFLDVVPLGSMPVQGGSFKFGVSTFPPLYADALYARDEDLDPSLTVQRVTRTDARVICCGHTHVADLRELGRKLLLNPGSCGYAFDGTPDACWALLTLDEEAEPEAELRRASYDPHPAAEEVGSRGLPGDVYRAATIRTGRFVR
jgi:hypothetical protein